MISMVESGKIGVVIVKDLSRLGREHIQLGVVTNFVFSEHNVRFIALQSLIIPDGLAAILSKSVSGISGVFIKSEPSLQFSLS